MARQPGIGRAAAGPLNGAAARLVANAAWHDRAGRPNGLFNGSSEWLGRMVQANRLLTQGAGNEWR